MAVLSLVTFLAGSSGLAGTVLCLPGLFRFKAPEAPGRLPGLTLELREKICVLDVRRVGRGLGVAPEDQQRVEHVPPDVILCGLRRGFGQPDVAQGSTVAVGLGGIL